MVFDCEYVELSTEQRAIHLKCHPPPVRRLSMIVLGVVLIVLGVILAILGTTGRAVGARRHYY